MSKLRWNIGSQAFTDARDVVLDFVIAQQRKLRLCLAGCFTPELYIVLNTVLVTVKLYLRLRDSRQRHHGYRDQR